MKILVSVVRFRPGPPNSNNALLMRGIFFWGLAGVDAIRAGYPHHELSFKRTYQLDILVPVNAVLNDNADDANI